MPTIQLPPRPYQNAEGVKKLFNHTDYAHIVEITRAEPCQERGHVTTNFQVKPQMSNQPKRDLRDSK